MSFAPSAADRERASEATLRLDLCLFLFIFLLVDGLLGCVTSMPAAPPPPQRTAADFFALWVGTQWEYEVELLGAKKTNAVTLLKQNREGYFEDSTGALFLVDAFGVRDQKRYLLRNRSPWARRGPTSSRPRRSSTTRSSASTNPAAPEAVDGTPASPSSRETGSRRAGAPRVGALLQALTADVEVARVVDALRYIRSMPSCSRVTCLPSTSTSATVRSR